ncbi:uncharacterized protein K452DRAFT_91584 [Aplosporella prunicola CBS 121167]|uniref:PRISE-like Rossmann-fold domain-containing protein n=1 Tax=Aplosporella prunicola CBS 121167 TaxID=1176127 RepID=A0A6A6B3W3_9PEZI|nr:uncharacterized protein K452DRAFT_91584 [Aplosporella prunicola CBS 121167]KAF2138298.1 hypothetical protein K452DRAFT_91584 [Aplosporella prunicola CBS 121167]
MVGIAEGRKTALVFGASGISGWAFVNEILQDYPRPGVWNKVHALTNRSLPRHVSLWPDDPRLNIVSGIDLLSCSHKEIARMMESRIDGIQKVTHVYFLAYKASEDFEEEIEDAVVMLQRAIKAVDQLCPALEFVVLQTSAKMYGCHLLENRPRLPLPLSESLPRLGQPFYDALFHHEQLDWLSSYAAFKRWNWCETRPDIIVGFVPHQNAYSLATILGVFLTMYKEIEGAGAQCPFPGTVKSWDAKSNDSSSDMIARQTLHLSLTLPPDRKGEAFNVADSRSCETWSSKWPQLCAYFGLKGTPPAEEGQSIEVRAYIQMNLAKRREMEKKYGLRSGIVASELTMRGFEYFLLTGFDFDRQYDMSKMYESTGFSEEREVMDAWGVAFDRMRAARMIP